MKAFKFFYTVCHTQNFDHKIEKKKNNTIWLWSWYAYQLSVIRNKSETYNNYMLFRPVNLITESQKSIPNHSHTITNCFLISLILFFLHNIKCSADIVKFIKKSAEFFKVFKEASNAILLPITLTTNPWLIKKKKSFSSNIYLGKDVWFKIRLNRDII